MRTAIVSVITVAALLGPVAALAQQPAPDQSHEHPQGTPPAQSPVAPGRGPMGGMGGGMHERMMGDMPCPHTMGGMMRMGTASPKTMGQMLQMRGEIMKAVGEIMMKHGKAMEEAAGQ
jgi:hypothetical protein